MSKLIFILLLLMVIGQMLVMNISDNNNELVEDINDTTNENINKECSDKNVCNGENESNIIEVTTEDSNLTLVKSLEEDINKVKVDKVESEDNKDSILEREDESQPIVYFEDNSCNISQDIIEESFKVDEISQFQNVGMQTDSSIESSEIGVQSEDEIFERIDNGVQTEIFSKPNDHSIVKKKK